MQGKIAVIQGDGIGKEIFQYVYPILDVMGLSENIVSFEVGLEKYKAEGKAFDDDLIDSLKECKAILFGAITTPKKSEMKTPYVSPLLTMRRKLNLFVNVRPSSNYIKQDLNDIIIFRENTEGLYIQREHEVDEETVIAEKVVTKTGTERIARFAFDYAERHNISEMTIISKSNVLKKSDGFFVENCKNISKDYPDIQIKEEFVDAACYHLVRNPKRFRAILTENLYGDILSDLVAGMGDGLGLAISECYGDSIALFEPVHGSAPDIAGKDIASPYAVILCLVSLLGYVGEHEKQEQLMRITKGFLDKKFYTPELGGDYKLSEIMNGIIKELKEIYY